MKWPNKHWIFHFPCWRDATERNRNLWLSLDAESSYLGWTYSFELSVFCKMAWICLVYDWRLSIPHVIRCYLWIGKWNIRFLSSCSLLMPISRNIRNRGSALCYFTDRCRLSQLFRYSKALLWRWRFFHCLV